MFQFFKKKSKTAFAVDVGSCYTKIMDVSFSGNEMSVQNFFIKRTPAECFDSGNVLDEEKLSQFLLQSLAELKVEKLNVIAGVTGKGFVTKKIDIPKMEHHLIGEHIPFEAEQYLPYEISMVDLDYEVLTKIRTAEPDHMPVLLIAVLKKTVEQYSSLFQAASLSCELLDANVFAMANAYEANYPNNEDENVLLIDIGALNTNLVVISKKQVIFTRNVAIGGEFYSKKIQESLNMSFDEAEDLKIRSGKEGGESSPEELVSLIKKLHQSFCDEVYTGYEFYLNFFPNQKISKVFMTGGGSQMPYLLTAMEEKLSVPVEKMNLFKTINISSDLDIGVDGWESLSAVCIGLALRNRKL